jgi:hypothetical protein
VNLIGGGYDFKEGAQFFSTLTPEVLNAANKGASKDLEKLGIDVTELGKKLSSVMPSVVAENYNTSEKIKVLEAQLDTIIDLVLKCAGKQGNYDISPSATPTVLLPKPVVEKTRNSFGEILAKCCSFCYCTCSEC